jgi:hypothetical protein
LISSDFIQLSRLRRLFLAKAFGSPARGWQKVSETLERAASQLREGNALAFDRISEYATAELAYIVEIERYHGNVGSSEAAPNALRVTTLFRARGRRVADCPSPCRPNHGSASARIVPAKMGWSQYAERTIDRNDVALWPHHVISGRRSVSVAFKVKRTFNERITEPD